MHRGAQGCPKNPFSAAGTPFPVCLRYLQDVTDLICTLGLGEKNGSRKFICLVILVFRGLWSRNSFLCFGCLWLWESRKKIKK